MSSTQHHLDIELLTEQNTVIFFVKIHGELQHEDYQIIVPQLEQALAGIEHPEIHALIDLTELEGWTWHAAWDDLRLGLKHSGEFTRLAVVGNHDWEKWLLRLSQWFVHGEARYFEDGNQAQDWLLNG